MTINSSRQSASQGFKMKSNDLLTIVLTSVLTVGLYVAFVGMPDKAASDTEIARSVAKGIIEQQAVEREKRMDGYRKQAAERRAKKLKELKELASKTQPPPPPSE